MSKKFSRRNFIGASGAGIAGAGLVGANILVGCSTQVKEVSVLDNIKTESLKQRPRNLNGNWLSS